MCLSTIEFRCACFLSFFFFCIPIIHVHAQQVPAEETLLQHINRSEKMQLLSASQIGGSVYIHQVGDQQQALIQQQGSAQNFIFQTGYTNQLFLQQSINAGTVNIAQLGSANRYEGVISAVEIETSLLQQGDFNSVWQQASGDQFTSEIIQQGYRNEIQQTAEGASHLKVYQRGNDMKVIIKSNN